jgi:hypothetical protein
LQHRNTMSFDLASHSHRRYNPITIVVAPDRNQRRWQG